MMKDKALEELFLSARPTFDDGDAFIRKLEKRLDAVEYLKQTKKPASDATATPCLLPSCSESS